MADRDDPARRAAADVSLRLDGQHHPGRLAVDDQAVHARHVEQEVVRRHQSALEAHVEGSADQHVEVFNRSVSLAASDPEGLDAFIPGPPRRPDQRSSTLKSEEPLWSPLSMNPSRMATTHPMTHLYPAAVDRATQWSV